VKRLCKTHYQRTIRGIDLNLPFRRVDPGRPCSVKGCPEPMKAKDLRLFHYERSRRGTPLDAPRMRRRNTWKPHGDGWFIGGNGYVCRSKIRADGARRVEYQHRTVMEEILARPLLPEENVHHKNGDRIDNRPENLELWTRSQPSGQRVVDKVAWAREILEMYAPGELAQQEKPWSGYGSRAKPEM
jgi:hypothetical protein